MHHLLLTLAALLACAAIVAVEPANQITLAKEDQDFLNKARIAGMYEVRSAELALKHSLPADVKRFAQQMLDDHTAANREIEDLAKKKGMTAPVALDAKHQDRLTKQEEAKAEKYVETWCEHQIAAHKDAVDLFEEAAKDARDADVRACATKLLPTLRAHLEHARKLESAHD